MRVEIVEKLPPKRCAAEDIAKDMPENHALRNFFSALSSEDSLFSVEFLGARVVHGAGQTSAAYCGDFTIVFRSSEDTVNTGLHFTLLEKLSELYRNAGSSTTMGVILSLTKLPAGKEDKPGVGLELRLEANGDSVEQAQLRWGLGLAHIQQGLLFASRWLRQRAPRE